ncbi:MAG: hypothetical protein AB7O78_01715 [Thermoleophilia bacterium]
MTVGLKASVANAILDAIGNATNYTAPTQVWFKLHTGDPGAAGTSNAAAETTRKQVSYAAASAGSMATDADVTWTNVSNTETYSHISAWDASTSGNFLFSDDLAASKSVTAGDTFVIPSGSHTVTLGTVAA